MADAPAGTRLVGPLAVLGASGFLGPHVVAAALAAGAPRVVAAARRPGAERGLAGADRRLAPRAVDLLEPGAAEALVAEERPAAVVLLAALSRVGACRDDPELAGAVNATLPGRVAAACAEAGARLVHVSTDLVFGGRPPRGERYDEEDAPAPLHAYGRSKADGEERALAAGADALVARLPLLYGDSLGRGLGASDQVLAALARGERPRLFTDEWRTPLEVGDAARALVALCAGGARGLLHVAGPARATRLELGRLVLAARGLPSDAVEPAVRADLGLAEERPRDVSLDAARARALLATPLRAPSEVLRPA